MVKEMKTIQQQKVIYFFTFDLGVNVINHWKRPS